MATLLTGFNATYCQIYAEIVVQNAGMVTLSPLTEYQRD